MAITWNRTGTTWNSSQALTGTAPAVVGDGVPVADLAKLYVTVATAVPASQTFAGGGTLQAYVFDAENTNAPGVWARFPSGDLTMSATTGGALAFAPMSVDVPRAGSICFVPNGVTVSAGATVTVYVLGFNSALAGRY